MVAYGSLQAAVSVFFAVLVGLAEEVDSPFGLVAVTTMLLADCPDAVWVDVLEFLNAS